jgi:hypothetical protein
MYRNDEEARAERASLLIDEIARLEREKLAHAATERRLEEARCELATLQPASDAASAPPGVVAHIIVGLTAALVTFTAFSLLITR